MIGKSIRQLTIYKYIYLIKIINSFFGVYRVMKQTMLAVININCFYKLKDLKINDQTSDLVRLYVFLINKHVDLIAISKRCISIIVEKFITKKSLRIMKKIVSK